MLRTCCRSLLFVAAVACGLTGSAAEKYKLEEPVDDVRVFGCGTRVDVNGKTQPSPNVEPLKLSASAALSYRERRLLGPGGEAEGLRERVVADAGHVDELQICLSRPARQFRGANELAIVVRAARQHAHHILGADDGQGE